MLPLNSRVSSTLTGYYTSMTLIRNVNRFCELRRCSSMLLVLDLLIVDAQ